MIYIFIGDNTPVVNTIMESNTSVMLIALDTNLETDHPFDFACGKVGQDQLAALESIITNPAAAEMTKVLFFHHHPFMHNNPFMELKDRLQSRRSKIVKLMVGDRQEKYKMEAALKVKIDQDPSSKMSAMRAKLDNLSREMDAFQKIEGEDRAPGLSPQHVIDADFEDV